MKKYIVTFYVSILFLISCASRKVDISKTEIKTNTDSTAITKTDSTSIINKNVYLSENSQELEIKPLVDSLPIVVNGISYKNVVLKYKKQNKILVDTSKEITSKNVLKHVSKLKQETKNTKEKKTDRRSFSFLWILILIIILFLIYRFKNLFKF